MVHSDIKYQTTQLLDSFTAASVLTCILCGTFSACGGGIICDILSVFDEDRAFTLTSTTQVLAGASKTNPETASPGSPRHSLRRSFLCAIIYYMLLNPSGYLPWTTFEFSKESGHLVICALQVLHFLLSSIWNVDIFRHVSCLLHICTNVPVTFNPPADRS